MSDYDLIRNAQEGIEKFSTVSPLCFSPLSSPIYALSWRSRQVTGSLRQEAIVSQKLLCDLVAVFAWFLGIRSGPQKPKPYCDNSTFATYNWEL